MPLWRAFALNYHTRCLMWVSLTYLLIQRYNRFAVLACLRSVRNRSRSRAFVCQSVIPTLMAEAIVTRHYKYYNYVHIIKYLEIFSV